METFSALLVLCAGNTGEFPSQRPVTRSFDLFFDLSLNKRLSEQSRRRWFEMPSYPLWSHCNVADTPISKQQITMTPQERHGISDHRQHSGNSKPGETVEQRVVLAVIWDTVTVMGHHCIISMAKYAQVTYIMMKGIYNEEYNARDTLLPICHAKFNYFNKTICDILQLVWLLRGPLLLTWFNIITSK